MDNNFSQIPVLILSGGYGIYIDDSGVRKAKANVQISGKPLIYYVILSYLQYGFRNFLVSGSYQLQETESLLKKCFFDSKYKGEHFNLEFSDSGLDSKTGDRLLKASEFLKTSSHFALTYSDTVSLLDLALNFKSHVNGNFEGSLTAVRLPTRFRIVGMRPGENLVRGFADKPLFKGDYINGGFYFFNSSILRSDIWKSKDNVVLETDLLDSLVQKKQLNCITYEGPWNYLDCERDLSGLIDACKMVEERG